jgi:hypothetical protein
MRWTDAALATAIAAGIGTIVATVWIGSRVREDTVVANPYEEGLRLTGRGARGTAEAERARCDLATGPCTRALPGGGEVTLEIGPRPLRTMAALDVRAELSGAAPAGSDDVAVAFSMVGMEMGENEVRLARADRAFAGTAVLVRCPSGRKDWVAEVRVAPAGAPVDASRAVRFPFTVEE